MTQIVNYLLNILQGLATTVPTPIFVLIGSFVEEFIAPIPSPFVMMLAGSMIKSNGGWYSDFVYIAIIGTVGKLLGVVAIYGIASSMGQIFIDRFGRYFGLTRGRVAYINNLLNKDWRDNLVIIGLYSIPIVPSSLISGSAGLLQLNRKEFFISASIGNIIRSLIFLYLGYTTTDALTTLNDGLSRYDYIGYGIVLTLFVLLAIFILKKRDSLPE